MVGIKNTRNLEQDIKAHVLARIVTMKSEYGTQILSWKPYLRTVADAHATAIEQLNNTFSEIRKQEERTKQLALLALSICSGVAVSWIGATLEKRMYPAFKSTLKGESKMLESAPFLFDKRNPNWLKLTDSEAVNGKVFGDFIGKTVGRGLDEVFSKIFPHKTDRPESNLFKTTSYETLKTKLENALDYEASIIVSQFDDMHTNTTNNYDLGKDMLEAVFKITPNLNKIDDERVVFMTVKEQIDRTFDELRVKYKEWLYFGNNPARHGLAHLARNVEMELWALWLLSEEFTVKPIGLWTGVVGKSGSTIHERVLGRLSEELGAVELYNVYWEIYSTMTETKVTTAKQLDTILKWARQIPIRRAVAKIDYIPRELRSISLGHAILVDASEIK